MATVMCGEEKERGEGWEQRLERRETSSSSSAQSASERDAAAAVSGGRAQADERSAAIGRRKRTR
jgi:hypothetical protein